MKMNLPKDEDIDFSDIPEVDEEFFRTGTWHAPRQVRRVVSLRLENEVTEIFRETFPKGYTSHMAEVLTRYAHELKKSQLAAKS